MNTRIFSLILVSASFLLLPASSSADDLAYPRHHVVSSDPEMSTHLGQFGLPGVRPRATDVSSKLAQIEQAEADYLIAARDPPTAVAGLPQMPTAVKAKAQPERGLFGSAEYLNWTLRRRDQDYAISSDPGAIVISGGEIHELQHPGSAVLSATGFPTGGR